MKEDFCPKCNNPLKITLTPETIHYGRLDCENCGFIGWARNPKSPKNNTTQSLGMGKKDIQQVIKFHEFKEEFCFFCLRNKNQLGKHETLTIDHIRELKESEEIKDLGNLDRISNMQILCSACHKLKNWCRLYMNWHFLKEENGNK